MLKCGLIGFGGLGKLHFSGLKDMTDEVKLVAICDVDENQFAASVATNLGEALDELKLDEYNLYTDGEEMMDKEDLDFIISAVPTYLHEKYATMALDKGIHVFSEKPMELTKESCQKMIAAAKRNNKLLMIGQCLRFSPTYGKLKEYIDTEKYGKLIRLEMHRLSTPPIWGWQNWFMDSEKSGGAPIDLHVHDIDYVNYVLGKPDAVYAQAAHRIASFDSIVSNLYYENGPVVNVTADWSLPESHGFIADFFAVLEKASCRLQDGKLMVYPNVGEAFEENFEKWNMHLEEKKYFVECIKNNTPVSRIEPESAMQSIEIALACKESAQRNELVKL